jgi:undecaprenyl pyrophosphate phosphatase UppP
MFWDDLRILVKEGLATNRRTNAVQPIAWLCAIVTLPCFFLAYKTLDAWLKIFFSAVGCVPVGLFVMAYLFFMYNDTDRLHSEDFQLKSRSLGTVEAKRGSVEILPFEIGTTDPSPHRKRISGPSREGGSDG